MKKGFTLVELLVVIAVIGILSAIITPNLLNARNSARIAAGQRFDSSVYHSIGDYLVGEWMFDVPSSSLIDTSGMGNNGTTSTDPVYYSTGGYNGKGAFYFDGSNDRIAIPYHFTNGSTNFTISVWVYLSSWPSTNYSSIVVENAPGSVGRVWFGPASNGYIMLNSYFGPGKDFYLYQKADLGKWYHLAAVFDRTGYEKLYMDGKLATSRDMSSAISDSWHLSQTFQIGGTIQSYYDGYIDDVRIYATALSSSDIQKLYTEGKEKHLTDNK